MNTAEQTAPPKYATRLQRIMAEEGRRSNWLAEQVGVGEGAVSMWLSGKRMPRHSHMARVAAALRRNVQDVWFTPIDAPLFSPDSSPSPTQETEPEAA